MTLTGIDSIFLKKVFSEFFFNPLQVCGEVFLFCLEAGFISVKYIKLCNQGSAKAERRLVLCDDFDVLLVKVPVQHMSFLHSM